ncbi:IS256 family transposase [Spirochaeta lutea]|uniref:Mutator family transposase n=1 Tax=Spirochaeta lutea TaxID=1480694 RepID=A0A098R034_9SPIO|nr:IS256 family transposase [Spirochaeta lutea]KGE70639.1 transposase [Spirochaeta lutea]KGE70859.1 transposase [Spirochaeta lutea]KGE71088.1 transposase [Spirochaeta lutea]KGE71147.1 transposase [Spirochaeta lutea]KGE71474.1 transposase [Spirochaeta lutea]
MAYQSEYTLLEQVIQMLATKEDSKFSKVIEKVVNEAMKLERAKTLQAEPYERTEDRMGYANGFKNKTLALATGKVLLKIPQVRGLEFYPSCIEKGIRSERALKLAIAEMYVKGVSTRRVSDIVEILCGTEVSSSQVSRLAKELDEEATSWRSSPVGQIQYLVLDATYESVRVGSKVVKQSLLMAIGVDYEGKRQILGTEVANSEAEVNWRSFLEGLVRRGLHGLTMITSDDHAGLRAAIDAVFPGILWQRCQFHLQQNARGYVTRKDDVPAVAAEIRKVFNAPDEQNAERYLQSLVEKYEKTQPRLAQWADENLREGLSVFHIPENHRRKLRTSNLAERQMKEIKRRTKVVGVFPNADSLLRLAAAMLIEQNDQWQNEKRYLPESNDRPAFKEIYRKKVA